MAVTKLKAAEYFGLKWVLLLLSIFGAFGFEYAFDIPAVIKDLMHAHFARKYSDEEFEIFFELLYSIMALPNMVIPLFLGILIDKFGVRINFTWMAIGIAIGASAVYIGVRNLSFTLLFIGRIIVGASGESIHIVEGLFVRQYFSTTQMSFVIAIIESSLHFGGVANAWVSPRLAVNLIFNSLIFLIQVSHLYLPFRAAIIICTFNAILICLACVIDRIFDFKKKEPESLPKNQPKSETSIMDDIHQKDNELDKITNIVQEFEAKEKEKQEEEDHQEEEEDNPLIITDTPVLPEDFGTIDCAKPGLLPYLSKIADFPKIYWFLIFAGTLTFPTILSFMMISTSYITSKEEHKLSLIKATVESAEIASLFRITSAISSPFLGFIIDKVGNRAMFLFIGTMCTMISHILAIFANPIYCCVLFGLSYAVIATTVWPSIYSIIDKKMLGIATGIANAVDNTGLFFFPLIVALIKNATGSYDYSQIFLASIAFIATINAFAILSILKSRRHNPNIPRLTPQATLNSVNN